MERCLDRRQFLALVGLAVTSAACSNLPFIDKRDSLSSLDTNALIKQEADYILSCQYLNPNSPAYGALNNVYAKPEPDEKFGKPTWIVPRENGLAILGLIEASKVLQAPHYLQRASLTADFLVRAQDQSDGGWFDQYEYEKPSPDGNKGKTKSPTQPAEVMIALHGLGFQVGRYETMKRGAQFLLACQDMANKKGDDDGLVGGGKNEAGQFHTWRWVSDNSFSYHALKAAEDWSETAGDLLFAKECKRGAERILEGLDNTLKMPNEAVWYRVVDQLGRPVNPTYYDWINYAPQMLDVPSRGVGSKEVGEWIHHNLQKNDGACVWDNGEGQDKKSPGFSFQASFVWLDLGQKDFADRARRWVLESGLWQTKPDANGITGGWIDWKENGQKAPFWQRFIDTSFYAIAAYRGGYNFKTT